MKTATTMTDSKQYRMYNSLCVKSNDFHINIDHVKIEQVHVVKSKFLGVIIIDNPKLK